MAESSPNGYKNTEGKGEIACDDKQFPTLFGKGLNVFHSYISLVSQNVSLCGNGLKCHFTSGIAFMVECRSRSGC